MGVMLFPVAEVDLVCSLLLVQLPVEYKQSLPTVVSTFLTLPLEQAHILVVMDTYSLLFVFERWLLKVYVHRVQPPTNSRTIPTLTKMNVHSYRQRYVSLEG